MQAKNVSELEDVSTLSDTDSILIGQSNTVKKTTFANIKSVFQALIGVVTSTVNGLMSYTDKNNLDALQTNFGGKSVVDSVTDGNLNPVTSNAVNDTLANYAERYSHETSTTVSSGTWTTLDSYSILKDGIYIITGSLNYTSDTNGIRICMLTIVGDNELNDETNSVLGTARCDIQRVSILKLSAGLNIYLRTYQNSGSSLTCKSELSFCRIG